MHELNELIQQSGLSDVNPDEVLLHYGVKGMKWDDKKGDDDQDKKDLKKIKKALANKIVARLKKAKNAPKKAVNNVKKKVARDAKFIKEHPIQAVKNATGITKREAKQRVADARFMKDAERDNPQAAKAARVLMKKQAERKAAEREAWKNVPKVPKLLKKVAIQTAKNKLGITKQESKARKLNSVLSKLDRHDPKVKKIESVTAPKHIPVKKKTTIRPKNLSDLVKLKMDTNNKRKQTAKRQTRTLPR